MSERASEKDEIDLLNAQMCTLVEYTLNLLIACTEGRSVLGCKLSKHLKHYESVHIFFETVKSTKERKSERESEKCHSHATCKWEECEILGTIK